jgi:3-oxoacyl-[acyl-carrier protein] reductase
MVDQRYGRIVNLSSSSALGNRGTANAVAPGFIATDMAAATAARLGMTFEDFQASVACQVPARRIGEVDDVAHAISFLASEGARYIFRPGDLRRGRPTVLNGRGVPSTPVTQPP